MFAVDANQLPSYQELSNSQTTPYVQSHTISAEQDHTRLFIKNNNSLSVDANKQLIIPQQSVTNKYQIKSNSINLTDLKISGFFRNSNSNELVSSVSLSGNYLAFDDRFNTLTEIYYNKNSSDESMQSNLINIKIANTNEATNQGVLPNVSSLPLKKITFNPDDTKIMLLFSNENKSELYLVNNDKSQPNYLDMNNADKITKFLCPIEYILDASYDTNGNILVAGMNNNKLTIWAYEPATKNESVFILKSSTIDDLNTIIVNITFNNDSSYLYVISKKNISVPNNILSIFQKNSNWQQATTVRNTKTLPADIDSSSDIMVFFKKNILTIKSLIDDTENSVELEHNISAACFIPGTKNLLVFDNSKKMRLLRYILNDKLSYNEVESINLSYRVVKAYFDPKDQKTVKIIGSNIRDNNDLFYTMLIACSLPLSASHLGGLLALHKIIIAELAAIKIGAIAGAGSIAGCGPVFEAMAGVVSGAVAGAIAGIGGCLCLGMLFFSKESERLNGIEPIITKQLTKANIRKTVITKEKNL